MKVLKKGSGQKRPSWEKECKGLKGEGCGALLLVTCDDLWKHKYSSGGYCESYPAHRYMFKCCDCKSISVLWDSDWARPGPDPVPSYVNIRVARPNGGPLPGSDPR